MSPSGEVMIRDPKPLVPPANRPDVMPAPNMTSFETDVVRLPLLAAAPLPEADAVVSTGLTRSRPPYSATRTSGYAAPPPENWTVTTLLPAAAALIFLA